MKKRILWVVWTERIQGYQICSCRAVADELSYMYRLVGLTSLPGWLVTTASGGL